MSFSCVLVGGAIRSVSRTLACLSRIGGEVTLEATADKLLLRTLAVSHAAYALVTLRADLFERGSFVNLDARGVPLSSQSEPSPALPGGGFVKCKLLLKHLLMAFRHTQHVERMEWSMQSAQNCLTIHMQAGGIRSTYRVPFESQNNILQADFPRSSSLNVLQFKASLMLHCLEPFPAKLGELTLMVHSPQMEAGDSIAAHALQEDADIRIMLRGGAEVSAQGMLPGGVAQVQQAAMTEITVPFLQLDTFNLPPGDVDLTFNVKEVRAFLQYCDVLPETDCRVSFGGNGSPMLLETVARHPAMGPDRSDDAHMGDGAQPLKMELVVATLAESQTQSQASPAATPQSAARQQAQQSQSPAHSQQQPTALSQGHAQSQAFLQKQSAAPIRVADEGDTVPPTP